MLKQDSWNSSVLYDGLDDPLFCADYDAALSQSKALLEYSKGLQVSQIDEAACRTSLERINRAMQLISKTSTFANMLFLTDSTNKNASTIMEKLHQADADTAVSVELLSFLIFQSGKTEQLMVSPTLAEYRGFFQRIAETVPHSLPQEISESVRLLQQSGGMGWARLRGQTEAEMTASITMNGLSQTLPITAIRGLYSHNDPNVRRHAQQADIEAGQKHSAVFAACLNGIKGEAQSIAGFRGFDSVLDWMLIVNRMRRETLDALMAAVQDALPVFQRYLKAKAKYTGCASCLAYCDISAPIRSGNHRYTLKQAQTLITASFSAVDSTLGAFPEHAFQNHWIDAVPRPGKQGGAMCIPLHTEQESRIFANFDGSLSGVITIAHELGHAWHDQCAYNLPLLLRDAPTPICETASAFAETLVYEHLLKTAQGKERLQCLNAVLAGGVQLVTEIYSRFLFEDAVFQKRKDCLLDADMLRDIMRDSQLAAYGSSIDQDALHPYMWIDKVHYYIVDYHYYNFPYTFGLLFARGLYKDFRAKPEGFLDRYSKLLTQSCVMSTEEAGKSAGLELSQKHFWQQALLEYQTMTDEFCRLAEQEGEQE